MYPPLDEGGKRDATGARAGYAPDFASVNETGIVRVCMPAQPCACLRGADESRRALVHLCLAAALKTGLVRRTPVASAGAAFAHGMQDCVFRPAGSGVMRPR
jgi:hypothetical protein